MWGSSAAPGKTKGPSGAEGRALESLQCRKRGAGADFEEADGEEFLCCLAKCGCFRRGAEKEGARCRASLPPPSTKPLTCRCQSPNSRPAGSV